MSEPTLAATPLAPPGGPCQPEKYVNVSVTASPGTSIQAGMTVQLIGVAQGVEVLKDCSVLETSVPFTWSLSFQPPGDTERDITSHLQNAHSLNNPPPSFLATSAGTYRARLTAGNAKFGTQTAEAVITATPPPPESFQVSGHVISLLVQDIGGDVEVAAQLDTQPDTSYGFQLRNDKHRPAHQGMLDLLREAFTNNWSVTLGGTIVPGENNGLISQTLVTK